MFPCSVIPPMPFGEYMLLLSNAVCSVPLPLFTDMKFVLSVTKLVAPLLNVMLDASSAHEPFFMAIIACIYSIESFLASLASSAARFLSLSARHASSFCCLVIFFSCPWMPIGTEQNSNAKITDNVILFITVPIWVRYVNNRGLLLAFQRSLFNRILTLSQLVESAASDSSNDVWFLFFTSIFASFRLFCSFLLFLLASLIKK